MEEIAAFEFQIQRGLNYLLGKGLVSSDPKPENILVKNSTLKIADLGSAIDQGNAFSPYIVTRDYRPPEVVLQKTPYSSKVDIWSAGCILAEMFIGCSLFEASSNDHLFIIWCSVLGNPTDEEMAVILPEGRIDPRPSMRTSTLENIMRTTKATPNAVELLKRVLNYDPARRPSAIEACASDLFNGLRSNAQMHFVFSSFKSQELIGCDADLIRKR